MIHNERRRPRLAYGLHLDRRGSRLTATVRLRGAQRITPICSGWARLQPSGWPQRERNGDV